MWYVDFKKLLHIYPEATPTIGDMGASGRATENIRLLQRRSSQTPRVMVPRSRDLHTNGADLSEAVYCMLFAISGPCFRLSSRLRPFSSSSSSLDPAWIKALDTAQTCTCTLLSARHTKHMESVDSPDTRSVRPFRSCL